LIIYIIGGGILLLLIMVLLTVFHGKGKPKSNHVKTTSQLKMLGQDKSAKTEMQAVQKPQEAIKSSEPQPVTVQIEKITKDGLINAVILDDETRSFGERHIDIIRSRDYGRPLLHINNTIFWLHRYYNERLSQWLIEPVPSTPYENLEHSPGETYEAVKNDEDIYTVFGKRNKSNGIKILWLILGTIGVLFIAFMAVNSKKDGG
jgi:hypothetical protein